jgi:hypothetical protein
VHAVGSVQDAIEVFTSVPGAEVLLRVKQALQTLRGIAWRGEGPGAAPPPAR